MTTIREFEKSLKEDSNNPYREEEKTRFRQNDDEMARMKSAEGEATPRLRHHEQTPQREQGVEQKATESTSSGEEEKSRLIDSGKVKMIQEKGNQAKKAVQDVFRRGKSWGWSRWLMGILGAIATLLAVALLTMLFARSMLPYPKHASCQVNITFSNDQYLRTTPICEAVKSAFVHQMKKWETADNCKDGGMKCLYKVTHVGDDELKGTHKTSDWFGFTDEMTFKFRDTASGDCFVEAFSRSTVPFAYLDFSVNYCNIHNLVEGYGFERFKEVTSDEVCTQYSTHNCEKY